MTIHSATENMKEDTISRIICEDLNVRLYTAVTPDTTREIARLHGTSPVASLLLGRLINSTALLSAGLKPESDQNITLKISGTGPIQEIYVQADARGNLRGYVKQPHVDELQNGENPDITRVIGAGFLSVVKDIGLRDPYSSVTPLATGDIALDVAHYLTYSEQVPSAIILGLELKEDGEIAASGGILIQRFPDTNDEALAEIEKNIAAMPLPLGQSLAGGEDIYSIASGLVGHRALSVLGTTGVRFSCRCSHEMLRGVVLSMNRKDLEEMLAHDHGVELTCTFCTKKYFFSEDELRGK